MTGSIFRRELLAFIGAMGRGGFIRLMVIYVGIFGLYLPSSIESPNLALLPFAFLPLYMAGLMGIDSIAGERERGTLETLLASPAGKKPLLWGKFLFSTTSGTAFLILSLLASVAFRAARGMAMASFTAVMAVLFICVVVSAFGAVAGMHVSLRARSSRSAQQWFAAFIAVFFVGAGALLKLFADRLFPGLKGFVESVFSLGWESPSVPAAGGVVLLVTAAMLAWLSGRMKSLWKLNLFK